MNKDLDEDSHNFVVQSFWLYSARTVIRYNWSLWPAAKPLSYIFLYLTNRCPCARIKIFFFQHIISGLPQGFITGSILFNFSINNLFFLIQTQNFTTLPLTALSCRSKNCCGINKRFTVWVRRNYQLTLE